VRIVAIKGVKKKAWPADGTRQWFCAHLVFRLFQVEGERRGNQIVEDRYVMLWAGSDEEAWNRARRYGERAWSLSLKTALGTGYSFLRIVLEEIRDIYWMMDMPSKPGGVEVFSRLRNRRIRQDQVWNPAARPRTLFERSIRQRRRPVIG
jgi:hypothetical protein